MIQKKGNFVVHPITQQTGETGMNFYICIKYCASLAQLVEQLIRNEQVVGSSPIGGSIDCGLWI